MYIYIHIKVCLQYIHLYIPFIYINLYYIRIYACIYIYIYTCRATKHGLKQTLNKRYQNDCKMEWKQLNWVRTQCHFDKPSFVILLQSTPQTTPQRPYDASFAGGKWWIETCMCVGGGSGEASNYLASNCKSLYCWHLLDFIMISLNSLSAHSCLTLLDKLAIKRRTQSAAKNLKRAYCRMHMNDAWFLQWASESRSTSLLCSFLAFQGMPAMKPLKRRQQGNNYVAAGLKTRQSTRSQELL